MWVEIENVHCEGRVFVGDGGGAVGVYTQGLR